MRLGVAFNTDETRAGEKNPDEIKNRSQLLNPIYVVVLPILRYPNEVNRKVQFFHKFFLIYNQHF